MVNRPLSNRIIITKYNNCTHLMYRFDIQAFNIQDSKTTLKNQYCFSDVYILPIKKKKVICSCSAECRGTLTKRGEIPSSLTSS